MSVMAVPEVAVTSCLNDKTASVYVWDVQTGSSLMMYRGDSPVAAGGLSLLAEEYVVAALQDKPLLRVWPINSQHPLSTPRFVCPGRISTAQASPDGCYIAVAVSEKIHVYQVASGWLVWSGVRHLQPIRVVRWSPDGALVVSGGHDGLVTVWGLNCVSTGPATPPTPRWVLADHSLPVTDLTVSGPRLVTVSSDCTCKIYDLDSGSLLVSIVLDSLLTAVALSPLETEVFVGTSGGTIRILSLTSPPRQLEYHTAEGDIVDLSGHSEAIRSLCVSRCGSLLLSGALDGSVKLWHLASRQCLRTLPHHGPVTNAFFAPRPAQMAHTELKPTVVLSAFQNASSDRTDCVAVITPKSQTLCGNTAVVADMLQTDHSSEARIKSMQMEIDLLRSINSDLHRFSVNKIVKNDKTVSNSSEVVKPTGMQIKRKKKKVSKKKSNRKK